MYKRSLEVSCYVIGASLFGFFIRWMQRMLAFDEAGLVSFSVWSIFVLLFIAADIVMLRQFLSDFHSKHLYLPGEFSAALANPGKLHRLFRYIPGGMVTLGGLALLYSCETDFYAGYYTVLGVCAVVTGVFLILFIFSVDKPEPRPKLQRLYALLPILLFILWVLACYKTNSNNSVIWDFAIEIWTCFVCMISFYKIAGFVFFTPDSDGSFFWCGLGCFMCIVSLADERYFGMQLMLLGFALAQAFYIWIMVSNFRKDESAVPEPDNSGFEYLRR